MSDSQIAVRQPLVKASSELSSFLGMEVSTMIDALKSQCFKGKRPEEVTDAQLATYVSTANALKLNPLLPGQMYAYPDRQGGGVTVMIGPDGVFTLLSNHPDVVAQKDGGPAFWTEHGVDGAGKETCTGYINHRTKGLLKKTIWVDEWVVSSNPNWQSRRHHMSEIRAQKQVSRMVIHGLPVDSDEHALGEMLNVTDTGDGAAEAQKAEPIVRKDPPKRAAKGAAAVQENVDKGRPIDVETVPAKPASTPEQAPPTKEKIAEPVAEPKATAAAPAGPKTTLADKETVVGNCLIEKVWSMIVSFRGTPTPAVQAKVSGVFTGTVVHINGAKQDGDKLVADPLWKEGANVSLSLVGQLHAKSGKINVIVEKIEAVEAAPNTAAELD